jgi:N-acyl-L-homoserine lactone synthetase
MQPTAFAIGSIVTRGNLSLPTPSGMEFDAYDAAGSTSSLLLSTRLGAVCGAVRLVFPDEKADTLSPLTSFLNRKKWLQI